MLYYVPIGDCLYARYSGEGFCKTAAGPGLLTLKNVNKHKKVFGPGGEAPSKNPILSGIPSTSARASSPRVVTLGTTGV